MDLNKLKKPSNNSTTAAVRTCACSRTTHPGSFRCALHRGGALVAARPRAVATAAAAAAKARQKARTMHALLLQIIKPSSHELYRRRDFQPKRSRFAAVGLAPGVEVV